MKQKSRVSSFLIVLSLLLFTFSMFTQDLYSEPQSIEGKWFNVGLGMGYIHGYNRAASCISGTLRKGNTTYSIHFAGLFRPLSGAEYDTAWDLGVLYGKALTPPNSLFLISGGIGLSLGRVTVKYDYVSTIGIPVEAQLLFKPFSSFGIGLYGFANLNTQQSYYGVTLCFTIGRS
jgi:hypothetical protein